MGKSYFDRLRKMKRFCLCEAILLLCIGGFSVAAILFGIGKQWLWCMVFIILIAVAIVLLVLYNKRMHRIEDCRPYALTPSTPFLKETVFEKLGELPYVQNSKIYSENEAVFFFKKNLHVRALTVYISDFSKSEFDRSKSRLNKKINKDFAIKHKISKFEAVKAVRVNLILTDACNVELYGFLSRNAAETMRRVEGILNIAVDLNRGEVLIPAMFGDCIFSDVRKYERCVKEICLLSGTAYNDKSTE